MKQVEKNERARFNWRGGLLYTLFIEIEVLVTAFVLTFAVYPVRFIFDEGFIRDSLEAIILVFIELLFRFIIFFVLFKNNKRLSFAYFAGGFAMSFGIRLIFSFVTSFAAFSAGMGVLEAGVKLTKYLINPEVESMRDVPKLLFIFVYILFEGLTLFMGYLASRLTEAQREKEIKSLKGEIGEGK